MWHMLRLNYLPVGSISFCQGRILLISPFPEVKKAVTLLGKIFLGFLVPLNHFQVPISSLLLLVPRNLLETHSYGNLQVSGLCELIL